jgi:hypothetical protein
LVLGAGAAIAIGAIPGADGNYHACVNKSSGAIRMVDESAGCRSSESRESWPSNATSIGDLGLKTYNKGSVGDISGEIGFAIAQCDDGDQATGGGYTTSGTNITADSVSVTHSEGGTFQGTGEWRIDAFVPSDTVHVHAHVQCLDLPPLRG